MIYKRKLPSEPSLDEEVRTCSRCGEKLTYFIAYIPGEGEVCMKCYTECSRFPGMKLQNHLILRNLI